MDRKMKQNLDELQRLVDLGMKDKITITRGDLVLVHRNALVMAAKIMCSQCHWDRPHETNGQFMHKIFPCSAGPIHRELVWDESRDGKWPSMEDTEGFKAFVEAARKEG